MSCNVALVQGVLATIKTDDVEKLTDYIEHQSVDKNIQFPPELNDEPEFLRNGAPLICAAAYFGAVKCLKYLVSIGADKNNADDDGITTSFYAAAGGRLGVIENLIELGFDVTGCGQAAIRFGHLDLFKDLVAKSVIKVTDTDFLNSTFLHVAAFYNKLDIAKYLLDLDQITVNAGDREGRTPLHLAAGEGFFEICAEIVKHGGDPFQPDRYEKSPMHYAAVQEYFNIIELFLGGDLNGIKKNGMTPLMEAAADGKVALVQLLLEIDTVKADLTNESGMNALHVALKAKQNYAARLLINSGKIDLNAQDGDGNTPMHWATRKKLMEMVEVLLKKGVNIHIKNKEGKTPLQDLNERIAKPPKPPGD